MKVEAYNPYAWRRALSTLNVPDPVPKAGEILVRVHATSVNGADKEFVHGSPAYARIYGWLNPSKKVLGSDVAGEVIGLGEGVAEFDIGDRVLGELFEIFGGFGELLCAPAKRFVPIPDGLDAVRASTVPQAGTIALQAIRGNVKRGDRVLINGAGGGAGCFAIQLAKLAGAEVTAVDTYLKADAMRDLGADHVIDYLSEDFAALDVQYDYILDLYGTRPARAIRRVLTPEGRYQIVGAHLTAIFSVLCGGLSGRLFSRKRLSVMAWKPTNAAITELCEMVWHGQLRAEVAKTFKPEMLIVALETMRVGHKAGKMVIVYPDASTNSSN